MRILAWPRSFLSGSSLPPAQCEAGAIRKCVIQQVSGTVARAVRGSASSVPPRAARPAPGAPAAPPSWVPAPSRTRSLRCPPACPTGALSDSPAAGRPCTPTRGNGIAARVRLATSDTRRCRARPVRNPPRATARRHPCVAPYPAFYIVLAGQRGLYCRWIATAQAKARRG